MDELTLSDKKRVTNHSHIDLCFENIAQHVPVVKHTLSEYGSSTVSGYTKKCLTSPAISYQSKTDLATVIMQYVTPLLGRSIANNAAERITKKPVVLTANHHGIDYFAQSVQSSLLFGLSSTDSQYESTATCSAIPVFACGNIPLNNLTYPRGALIYPGLSEESAFFPVKVPLFPDRLKRTTVSKAPAFDEQMIQAMQKKIAKMQTASNQMSHACLQTLSDMLEQEYRQDAVLSLSRYSDQSVIVNHKLWQRMFAKNVAAPPLVYLELERVASMLLELDLKNTTSLIYLLLFEPKSLNCLYSELKPIKGSGTFLFWGIDKAGRRVSLFYDPLLNTLNGVSDQGDSVSVAIDPSTIVQQLQDGQLLPSLFTCFLVIAFARGITCAGGYYQAEYLAQMQQAVISALRVDPEWAPIAEMVKGVNSEAYLSGMQLVVTPCENAFVPSGPIEIISAGGLTNRDIQCLQHITVKQAHTASILETLADVMPEQTNKASYIETRRLLAEECRLLLQDSNIIVKPIF